MSEQTTVEFSFFGDYAQEYAAQAYEEGFARGVEERSVTLHSLWGGGCGSSATETLLECVKSGFCRPGPCGPTEVRVGAQEWVRGTTRNQTGKAS